MTQLRRRRNRNKSSAFEASSREAVTDRVALALDKLHTRHTSEMLEMCAEERRRRLKHARSRCQISARRRVSHRRLALLYSSVRYVIKSRSNPSPNETAPWTPPVRQSLRAMVDNLHLPRPTADCQGLELAHSLRFCESQRHLSHAWNRHAHRNDQLRPSQGQDPARGPGKVSRALRRRRPSPERHCRCPPLRSPRRVRKFGLGRVAAR